MNPIGFAYHALRSAGWWVRCALLVPLLPFALFFDPIGCEWVYSASMGRVAWQSARRAMGWSTRW